jgi:hypothetical protein
MIKQHACFQDEAINSGTTTFPTSRHKNSKSFWFVASFVP